MSALQFEHRNGYLYFKFSKEPIDLGRAGVLMDRVLTDIRLSGINRILFQLEESEQRLNLQDYYAIAERLGREISGLKAAILTAPDLHTPETAFFELAIGSAGNQLRYFTGLDAAEAWLRQP